MTRWEFITGLVHTPYFWMNIAAFLAGVITAPVIHRVSAMKKWYQPLLKMGLFYQRMVKKILGLRLNMAPLILFIFFANSLTATLIYLSGFIPFFPVFYIFLTGFMVRLVMLLDNISGPLAVILLNPVTIMELLAIGIAGTMGMQLSLTPEFGVHLAGSWTRLQSGAIYFVHTSLFILLFSAVLEGSLIRLLPALEDKNNPDKHS